jgi:hypothetical protein
LAVVVWNAFVYQYVQTLETKQELSDTNYQMNQMAHAVQTLSYDVEFEEEVVELVINEVCSAIQEQGITIRSGQMVIHDGAPHTVDIKSVSKEVAHKRTFQQMFFGVLADHFKRDSGDGSFPLGG